jgi:signal transduction histidine kinase
VPIGIGAIRQGTRADREEAVVKSLFHRLLLFSCVIITIPMGLAILWTSNMLSTQLERQFAEKSEAQAEQVRLLLREKQGTATGLVHWIAETAGVGDSLRRKDRNALFQHLLPLVDSIEMDFIEIFDAEGRVFLRVHDPSRYGDRSQLASDVGGLLRGMRDLPSYGVDERDGRIYLRAAQVVEAEKILGVVTAGYAISIDFIRKLEQAAAARAVIDVAGRIFTGAGPEAGTQRVAERPSTIHRETRWHWEEESPSLEIQLPLDTERGVEGAISLFFPLQELIVATTALRRALLAVAVLGIILAFSISWVLSRRLTRPLKELVGATERVAGGNYAARVAIRSKGELGVLADSFNRMLEELGRSKAEAEGYRRGLERKFAERGEELAETERKRAAMAHMVAHDLKNPLLGIKKTLERLQQNPTETDSSRKQTLEELLGASDLVIGMVNEMLDLYRSDFGELPLSLSSFAIDEPIQASLNILRPEIEEKRLKIVFQPAAHPIAVTADKRRLTRLVTNLISNAIKFSPAGGHVYISLALQESVAAAPQWLLRIEDEGSGIPESDLTKIFDGFYAPDSGRIEGGTGLGLPYCKLVAEAHKGVIWAERRELGGLSVSVLLPVNSGESGYTYAH